MQVGQNITCKVLQVQKQRRKILLSLKQMEVSGCRVPPALGGLCTWQGGRKMLLQQMGTGCDLMPGCHCGWLLRVNDRQLSSLTACCMWATSCWMRSCSVCCMWATAAGRNLLCLPLSVGGLCYSRKCWSCMWVRSCQVPLHWLVYMRTQGPKTSRIQACLLQALLRQVTPRSCTAIPSCCMCNS